ncbi:MAG: dephospho-CoA kinase [Thermotogota bacterium]|nr:dephospho-CoA kinase [Thermotogota bacterium]
MNVIGLTGKVGSGKTMISRALSNKGFILHELDKIGHKILRDIPAKLLMDNFGKDVVNKSGKVDRKKLGDIVFSSQEKLKQLNTLVHPKIFEEVKKRITFYNESDHLIDGALLFDVGLSELCNCIIWIDCPEELAVERMIEKGISKEKTKNILRVQKHLDNFKNQCDKIFVNNSSPDVLINSIISFLKKRGIML